MLILVVLVLDFTEKNDTYIRNEVPASEILQYMLNYGLYLNNLLTPITVFISVIFITSKMAGRTEIIAILSSGVSFLRMLLPFLFSAFLIAVVSFFLNGWVLPVATEGVSKFRVEYLDKGQDVNQQNIHIKVAPNLFAYMRRYFTSVNQGHDFTLENIKEGKLISKFSAERIVWDTAKHVWNARNWRLREFNEMGRHGLQEMPWIPPCLLLPMILTFLSIIMKP